MIILTVLIVILFLLLLLLSVPVGADIGYNENGLRVFIRVWRFTFCVFPKQREESKKTEKKKKKTNDKKTGLPDATKDEMLDAFSVALRALKKLRFELYRLKLHFVSAFEDPYQTAMVYAYANAAIQALGLAAHKHADVQLGVDFERETYYFDGYVSVTVRIYSIMMLCGTLIWGMIPILWRRRKRMQSIDVNTAVKGKVA